MPRALWRGSLSFGLVNVPVRLFSASKDNSVHFHQIDAKTGSRIRHKRVSEKTGREVPDERIASGYETSRGRYVVLDDDELTAAEPARTHTIDIEDFVALDEIDPIHFDRTFWMVPNDDVGAKRAYVLLRDALEDSGRVGIGRFVLRTKEHLVAVRPLQRAIALHTLRHADEVVKASSLDGQPVRVKVGERELASAKKLIRSLTTEWDPARYRDRHREKLLDIIQRKGKGQEIVVEEAPEPAAEVVDLMAALEESVKRSAQRRSRSTRKRSRAKKSA
jgi:DNA end-binding protein Ku